MNKDLHLKGRQRSVMLVLLLMLAVVAFAVPAKPGLTRMLTLTDGTTVNATLVGDEYLHYWLGDDGNAYQAIGDGVYHSFDPQAAQEEADQRRSCANQQRARRLAPRKVGNVEGISGKKKGLIILVNFTDVTFQSANNNALYQRIANEKNFSYTVNSQYSFKGSMYDYFYDQSEGKFELTFDVVGPVTVSQSQAYYGENDSSGYDKYPGQMVKEAVQLADEYVNFADYDWDANGVVEQIYVIYAGKGEADGGGENTIWPHQWDLYSATDSNLTLDGKTVSTYACGSELSGWFNNPTIAGIGTMCHEFSHCLGFPDFYDIDYGGGQGMGNWDLMCSGSYNDGGYQPAGYTSYERWAAGWKEPTELVSTQTISNMKALQTTGSDTYVIYNKGNRNEYYLLENRQKIGWDASLKGEGLLILHVDYDANVWSQNEPNDDPSHQRMTWIPADNEYQKDDDGNLTAAGLANDPFPYGSVNAFGKNTTPAAKLYNKNSDGTYYLDCSILDITQNSDSTISFNFNGESNMIPVDPFIYVDESLLFSTTVGTSQTQQFEVLSEGLTEDITLTLNDANNVFSLGTTTIPKDSEDATVDVTFSPTAAGEYIGTITLTSAGAETVTVQLSGTATSSNPNTKTFKLVTSTDNLESGMRYIIACGSKSTAAGGLSSNILSKEDITVDNNIITIGDNVAVFVLEGNQTNGWTFKNESSNQYLYATDVKKLAYGSTANTWTLSNATAGVIMAYSDKGTMLYNVNNPRFTTYTSDPSTSMIQANLYMEYSEKPANPTLAYYKNADGKKGETLKTAMCGIIYTRTEKSYDYLWTAYHTTDVRSDGKIWDMYSNITNYEPGGSAQGANSSAEGDSYNREHSFPKSWFGSNVPMYTDLHHIYPTDGYVNNRHSNYPFGETNGETYKSANDFSKLGACTYPGYTGTVFEPADEYKGDFARTYFYMVTCYEEKLHDWYTNYSSTTEVDDVLDGSTYPGFQAWQLEMLMKWAKNDPVSEKETNRNNAVYAIQNNRNPFIDYPGLEEYVWGSMTTTAFSYDNYVQPVYKQDVTMSFSPTEATATLGMDFTEPTLTTTPDGLTVTYSSNDTEVATVDATTGEVTLVAGGTTTITASFAGDDTYNSGSASYTLNVSNPSLAFGETLLYEGVSSYKGSNDSSTELTTTSDYLNYKNWSSISKVYPGGNAQSNGGCLKFGSSNGAGSMTTGSISLTGGGTLTFYLKQYGSDTGKLKVTVTGAIADVTEFTPASTWTLCTVNLTKATGTVTIKLETTANRSYVDEITLTSNNKLILANNGDNATNIAAAATNGGKFDVTLKDRTLYRDGKWNTLCLPFDVNMNTDDCLLHSHGLTVMTLDGTTSKFDNGTLTLNFTTVYDGDTYKGDLVAGTPYIIKWTGGQQHLTNPVFYGVTIDNDLKPVTASDGSVTFTGIYDYMTFTDATASILFLGSGNNLYYPLSDAKIGAQRAYFQLNNGITVDVNNARMCFGDEKTEIVSHSSPLPSHLSGWYTLDGRKLDGVGTDVKGNLQSPLPVRLPKGIYIHNGRKVVIK